jgi:hypothetical protein
MTARVAQPGNIPKQLLCTAAGCVTTVIGVDFGPVTTAS